MSRFAENPVLWRIIAPSLTLMLMLNRALSMKLKYLLLPLALVAVDAAADDQTLNAAIGGAIGGATGAAIGNELGGRDAAIVGGALGAAAGTAIATDPEHKPATSAPAVRYEYQPAAGGHPNSYQCPPGQRKKGRC